MVEKLADSLSVALTEGTPRRVHGTVALPGKATAVVGMRRSGKTTFLHQIRRERLAGEMARKRLPFVNFEDERLAGLWADELHVLIKDYYRRCAKPNNYLLLRPLVISTGSPDAPPTEGPASGCSMLASA